MSLHGGIKWALNLAIIALFMFNAGGWLSWPFLQQIENLAYDARLRLLLPGGLDPRIVIVDIDERSLREEGQWPWSRDRLALLVEQLFTRYQIAVLGFDVVFAEADNQDDLFRTLLAGPLGAEAAPRATLETLRQELDPDRRFAAALDERPVVLGYFFDNQSAPGTRMRVGALPAPVARVSDLPPGAGAALRAASGYGANLPLLQTRALGGGFFNSPLVDSDGVFRRVPLLVRYEDGIYEHLALAVVRALLGQPPLEFVTATGYSGQEARLEALRLGGFQVPLDAEGAVQVPYRGRQGSFPYVAAADVLHGRADPKLLNGAVVLVGTTAAGLLDLRATPVQNVYPGVEVNANLIAGLLDQNFRVRPPYAAGVDMVQLLLVGLLGALAGSLAPLWALLLSMGTALALFGVNLELWQTQGLIVALAPPLVLLLSLYVLNSSYNVFIEARRERYITRLFGQYVPREIVAEMSRGQLQFSQEGESRAMTVLFSDIEGFTSISEQLEPRELSRLMQFYLTPLTRIIHEQRGTIDKYIGDAIMAFWGAPLTDAEHGRHAVRAALEMVARLRAMAPELRARSWPLLRARIGINSGMMSVGNMGSEFRRSYTVLGDAVNLASRIEGTAKQYGVAIVISEYTRALVPEITCRELDRVRVKGRSQPVTLYEPLGLAGELDDRQLAELSDYMAALTLFRAGEWLAAEQAFDRLLKRQPGTLLYELYWERAVALRAAPPEADWDGVFDLTTK
jgi:adenylate cyclase